MDFKLPLAGVLISGAAVGLMLPTGAPESSTGASAASADDAGHTLALAQVDAGGASGGAGDQVTLPRAADGHFYADITVDGQDFHMLVDTGASVVALTGADAEAMGLTWHENDVRPVAQGASGPVYGVNTVIEHMALGGLEARDVQALIIPEGLAISLLGQSFLGTVGSVEMRGDAMMLGNADQWGTAQ